MVGSSDIRSGSPSLKPARSATGQRSCRRRCLKMPRIPASMTWSRRPSEVTISFAVAVASTVFCTNNVSKWIRIHLFGSVGCGRSCTRP
jgi:hypothetical protein